MQAVLQRCGATRLEVSRDEAQRLKFWSGRKNAFPASGRISPDYMCMDSTIPRKRLADILLAIQQMEATYGLRCANVFPCNKNNWRLDNVTLTGTNGCWARYPGDYTSDSGQTGIPETRLLLRVVVDDGGVEMLLLDLRFQ